MCAHAMEHTQLPGWWCRCEAVASPGMVGSADVSCHQCHVCAVTDLFFLMYCVTPSILVNCPPCKILIILFSSCYLHYLKLFILL